MNKEETAKRFGFNDLYEMELFHDICGFERIPCISNIEDAYRWIEDDTLGNTKEEFIQYMEDNLLIDLVNRLKDLSKIDRYKELYVYNAELLLLSTCSLKLFGEKFSEATDLFDGEKQEIYCEKISRLESEVNIYDCRLNYLKENALYELDYVEQDDFYMFTEKYDRQILDIRKLGRKK